MVGDHRGEGPCLLYHIRVNTTNIIIVDTDLDHLTKVMFLIFLFLTIYLIVQFVYTCKVVSKSETMLPWETTLPASIWCEYAVSFAL